MGFGEFFLRITPCNPKRTRKHHVARLGSQSQSRIRLVLPAYKASHVRNKMGYFAVSDIWLSKIDLHEVSMGVCAKNNSQVKFS